MLFHGLMNYDYNHIAEDLSYKTFYMVLNETSTREYYSSITGMGQGLNPFWGWSNLAYFMPLEYEARCNNKCIFNLSRKLYHKFKQNNDMD